MRGESPPRILQGVWSDFDVGSQSSGDFRGGHGSPRHRKGVDPAFALGQQTCCQQALHVALGAGSFNASAEVRRVGDEVHALCDHVEGCECLRSGVHDAFRVTAVHQDVPHLVPSGKTLTDSGR